LLCYITILPYITTLQHDIIFTAPKILCSEIDILEPFQFYHSRYKFDSTALHQARSARAAYRRECAPDRAGIALRVGLHIAIIVIPEGL
jgi:hypothetical protein